MSGPSPSRQLSGSKEIPTRKMVIDDPSQLPDDYSTTPNGTTWFSTTPGGTRIIYERKFLMNLRNSPLARTPPANLPIIPGVTVEADKAIKTNGQVAESKGKETVNNVEGGATGDEPQFQMDI